tara:strand:+ start:922 stop:1302 length:381 start_codon:yes stop_codon:yes gene_type:complete
MYVIINIAGKQYKASKGQNLRVPKIDKEIGAILEIDKVLFLDDGKSIHIGKPNLKDTSVTASIINHGRERKILVYKKKRRKGYQRKNGHRQDFTEIEIKDIHLSSSPKKKESKKIDSAPAIQQEEE